MLVAGEASQMFVRGAAAGNGGPRRFFDRPNAAAPAANAANAAPGASSKRALVPRTPLHSHFRSLAAAFELSASLAAAAAAKKKKGGAGAGADDGDGDETPIPTPLLCGDCASRVAAELELEAEAALEEAALAEQALVRLQAQAQEEREAKERERAGAGAGKGKGEANDSSPLEAAKAAAAAAERRAAAAASSLRAAALSASQAAADSAAVDALERAYWLELDAALSAASTAADDAAATLCRAERASASLESLKSRDAICDLHRIWVEDDSDGSGNAFATVAGCRAGRGAGLGWDEANAAFGSAARLLATLVRVHSSSSKENEKASTTSFFLPSSPLRLRILPAGSTPRVVDARTGAVHDLFGPVNTIYCPAFDKGVALFAGGVRDFALAAAAADRRRLLKRRKTRKKKKELLLSRSVSPSSVEQGEEEKAFSLPFEIEPSGEKVGGLSLRLSLSKDRRWSRALKLLLTDLQSCAAWSARERARRFRGEEEDDGEGEEEGDGDEEEEEEQRGVEAAGASSSSTTPAPAEATAAAGG